MSTENIKQQWDYMIGVHIRCDDPRHAFFPPNEFSRVIIAGFLRHALADASINFEFRGCWGQINRSTYLFVTDRLAAVEVIKAELSALSILKFAEIGLCEWKITPRFFSSVHNDGRPRFDFTPMLSQEALAMEKARAESLKNRLRSPGRKVLYRCLAWAGDFLMRMSKRLTGKESGPK